MLLRPAFFATLSSLLLQKTDAFPRSFSRCYKLRCLTSESKRARRIMPLSESSPNVWHHKTGGGAASLFGLPFFLVGVGVIGLAFIPQEVSGVDHLPLYFGLPFGAIFATVGGAILFGRRELIIDRSEGTIIKDWKLLSKTVYEQSRELKEFDRIRLNSEIRRSKNSSYTVYPIRLEGDGAEAISISEARAKNKARAQAESLATFLSLPIHDKLSGSVRVRDADTLDQSIREKFQSGTESNVIPDPPARMKSRVDYDGNSLQVQIPPPGFDTGFLIAFIAIAFFELIFIFNLSVPFFSNFDRDSPALIFVIIFSFFFLVIPNLILLGLLGNTFLATQSVSVSNQTLSVTKGWPLKKSVTLASNHIEELVVAARSKSQGNRKAIVTIGARKEIQAMSDDTNLSFGAGLSEEELAYIHALAKGILVS